MNIPPAKAGGLPKSSEAVKYNVYHILGEAVEQVGGFFTGIGEVAYETGAELASLGSSIKRTSII